MTTRDYFLSLFSKKNQERKSNHKNHNPIENDADGIKGIDLKIDDSVQHLCQVYNDSSGSTRSVIYVLLVINILSLMAVMNTHPHNWTETRISTRQDTVLSDIRNQAEVVNIYNRQLDSIRDTFKKHRDQLKTAVKGKLNAAYKKSAAYKSDSAKYINDSIHYTQTYLLNRLRDSDITDEAIFEKNALVRNEIENAQHVSIPLLGNAFDIDNLALVSGISFMLLLTVVRFTLTREKNNLRIAFHAITERYDDVAVKEELQKELEKIEPGEEYDIDRFARLFNFKRRRYHYNFLSMNEIFNMPKLDISSNTFQKTRFGKIVKSNIFSFPFIIYMIVFANDLLTWQKGFQISFWHTIISYIMSLLFLSVIARLCDGCNKQKNNINDQFDNFYYNEYTCNKYDYLKTTDTDNKLSFSKQFFYAAYFFGKLSKEFYLIIRNRLAPFSTIQFDYASSALKITAYPLLDATSAELRSTAKTVTLAAFASPDEEIEIDILTLANNRANAIKIYLITSGVDSKQLKIQVYGTDGAIADNATDEGKVLNRRVEFHEQ